MDTLTPATPPGKPSDSLTFDSLAAMEPGLASLEAEIKAYHSAAALLDRLEQQIGRKPSPRCANAVWYHTYKDKVVGMVGWGRTARLPDAEAERVLRSVEAYDCVYDAMYHLLPDCRGCQCLPADFLATAVGNGVRQ